MKDKIISNWAKMLDADIRKAFFGHYRDFDRDDLPPITHCQECGYDGENLEFEIEELKNKIRELENRNERDNR